MLDENILIRKAARESALLPKFDQQRHNPRTAILLLRWASLLVSFFGYRLEVTRRDLTVNLLGRFRHQELLAVMHGVKRTPPLFSS